MDSKVKNRTKTECFLMFSSFFQNLPIYFEKLPFSQFFGQNAYVAPLLLETRGYTVIPRYLDLAYLDISLSRHKSAVPSKTKSF